MATMQIRGNTQIMPGSISFDRCDTSLQALIGAGVDFKESCRVATTANITLSGTQTIDGVALSVGNRVLVKNQSTASQNGIYVVASGSWSRALDANSNSLVTAGMTCWVSEGTTNADTQWLLITDDPITLGTTALSFTQVRGLGQLVAGAGLTLTGNTLDVGAGQGITVNADDVAVYKARGLTFDGSNRLEALLGDGLKFNNLGANEIMVKLSVTTPGLQLDSNGLAVLLDTNPGLQATSGLKIKLDTGSNLVLGSGGIKVNANPTFTTLGLSNGGGSDTTLSADGSGDLVIGGGAIANGNYQFKSGGNYLTLTPEGFGNYTITIPNRAGTVALRGDFIHNETPSGSVNGSNVTFTLANTPQSGKLLLFLNGLLQEEGSGNDFTISGTTITMAVAPTTGDKLRATYFK